MDAHELPGEVELFLDGEPGTERWLTACSWPLLGEQQEVAGGVTVFHDTTDRHRVEQLKRDFVSTVSHELRTPLTSVSGSLGLVLGGAAGELPASARNLLQIADRNAARLVRLINDLLDIEKLASGGLEIVRRGAG